MTKTAIKVNDDDGITYTWYQWTPRLQRPVIHWAPTYTSVARRRRKDDQGRAPSFVDELGSRHE